MADKNLQRMLRLAEEFFAVKSDPSQISVDEEVLARLQRIHPATVSEERDENGPIAWVLVVPTTQPLMEQFVTRRINERELLEKTPIGAPYTNIYLCSALVLPEFRGQGRAKRMAVDAIRSIQSDHRIGSLFFWAFSAEGKALAASIAREASLPLYERPERRTG